MYRTLHHTLLALALLLMTDIVSAGIDLRNASVERLGNGLTVILLEDQRFPAASVQMLYRVGARNEVTGKTGLAHFLEHMAFRDSAHYPDTELVSRIYAAGGEWHGYTWIDQTTYFATVPGNELDLLLRIEADRMSQLLIQSDDMTAERGAVLAEMHMYEDSPTSMLIDAVNFTSFLAHPYRNNTIGWESDIENLQHRDVVDFYRQHYHPANAVMAVVGDFDRDAVSARIQALFGALQSRPPTPLPHTIEPVQDGVRRITLHGNGERRQFLIAYRAPAASDADFAAFLVLQSVLGASSGINFAQNDWGTPVREGAVLHGAAEDMTTWFPPSAQNYVFTIGGFAPDGVELVAVEAAIELRLAAVRDELMPDSLIERSRDDVLDQLVFDVETTEDAAHQLAFFDGLNALDTLLELPQRLAAVTPIAVQRLAQRYLLPERRTIAWHLPAMPSAADVVSEANTRVSLPGAAPVSAPGGTRIPEATMTNLSGGIPLIVQRSDFSSSVTMQLRLGPDRALSYSVRPHELAGAIETAVRDLRLATAKQNDSLSLHPETRLEQVFEEMMRPSSATVGVASPTLIVVAGDVSNDETVELLEQAFGSLEPPPLDVVHSEIARIDDRDVKLGSPLAQARHGYIVAAPGPAERLSDAYRLLLYILVHDYEGRLGKNAISNTGLAYYIGSEYRSDGKNSWVTLSTGVDPAKMPAFMDVFSAELERLGSEPPTDNELREAKNHMLGRLQSAAQSNAELADQLSRQWLWYGEVITVDGLRRRLAAVSREDLLEIIPAFVDGANIVVAE